MSARECRDCERGQCLLVGIVESGDRLVTHDEVAKWAAVVRGAICDGDGPVKVVDIPAESIIAPGDWKD